MNKEITYTKSVSATLLWVIKLVYGVFAAYGIYIIAKPIVPVFREIGVNVGEIGDLLVEFFQAILNSAGIANELNISLQNVKAQDIYTVISSLYLFVFILIIPVLSILDAIGATFLRFMNRGAGLIKATHNITAIACLLLIIDGIGAIVMLITMMDLIDTTLAITMLIILGFGILIIFLAYCYHRDIAKTMTTIRQNIENGKSLMSKTHLSGLSIFAGLLMTLALIDLVAVAERPGDSWIAITAVAVIAVKQFLVAVCYRGVKQYNMCR